MCAIINMIRVMNLIRCVNRFYINSFRPFVSQSGVLTFNNIHKAGDDSGAHTLLTLQSLMLKSVEKRL